MNSVRPSPFPGTSTAPASIRTTGPLGRQDLAKADPQTVQALEEKAEDLFEATNWAVEEWDLAMKGAIQSAKYAECVSTKAAHCTELGGTSCPGASATPDRARDGIVISCSRCGRASEDDIDDAVDARAETSTSPLHRTKEELGLQGLHDAHQHRRVSAGSIAERGSNDVNGDASSIGQIEAMAPVIVLCHNPVTNKDHPACGAPGLAPRLGEHPLQHRPQHRQG